MPKNSCVTPPRFFASALDTGRADDAERERRSPRSADMRSGSDRVADPTRAHPRRARGAANASLKGAEGTDPSRGRGGETLSFVVQKHAARRLHYDLRLELDGVLKSWAVTRGPSLVAGVRRLAVEVADHALDYGGWEGVIPEGRYGAGTVIVWDRGTWEPDGDPRAALAQGRLAFTLAGQRLRGRWHLLRAAGRDGSSGDKPRWFLIKGKDPAARPSGAPDILEEHVTSILSGRTNDEMRAVGPSARVGS